MSNYDLNKARVLKEDIEGDLRNMLEDMQKEIDDDNKAELLESSQFFIKEIRRRLDNLSGQAPYLSKVDTIKMEHLLMMVHHMIVNIEI